MLWRIATSLPMLVFCPKVFTLVSILCNFLSGIFLHFLPYLSLLNTGREKRREIQDLLRTKG